MDFKFKEVVEESIIYFYDHVLSCNEYTEDVFEELDHLYAQAPKADEYEAKNKELLEELQYLRKVNDDLVWQRDTDEEHEAKATAWDKTQDLIKDCTGQFDASGEWDTDWCAFGNGIDEIIEEYESGGLDV